MKSLLVQVRPTAGVFARFCPEIVTQLPGEIGAVKLAAFTTDEIDTLDAAGGAGGALLAADSHAKAERNTAVSEGAPSKYASSKALAAVTTKTRPLPNCVAPITVNGPFGSPGCCVGCPDKLFHAVASV